VKSLCVLLFTILLIGGCAFAPAKAALRKYEKLIADQAVESSDHILCNAPLSTIMAKYQGSKMLSWMSLCGYELEGYKMVKDSE